MHVAFRHRNGGTDVVNARLLALRCGCGTADFMQKLAATLSVDSGVDGTMLRGEITGDLLTAAATALAAS